MSQKTRDDTRPAEPQMRAEPKPRFPEQHQRSPGLEARLEPRPRYEARRYRPAGKLEGKRALVTGGDSGIGRAVAVLYAREGADVAIAYLPQEQQDAEETQRAIEAEGRRCLLIPGDLSDVNVCNATVEQTVSTRSTFWSPMRRISGAKTRSKTSATRSSTIPSEPTCMPTSISRARRCAT